MINATASLTKNSLLASKISLALLLSSVIPTGSAKSTVSNGASTVCTGSTPNAPDLLPTSEFVELNAPLTLISSTSVEFSTAVFTTPVALVNSWLITSPFTSVTGAFNDILVTKPNSIVRKTSANLASSLASSGVPV